MKIVRFIGGLGNQMFQQAFLIALEQTSGDKVYIDTSEYSRKQQHNGYELERVFGIKNLEANYKDISKFTCLFHNSLLNKIYTKLSFLRQSDIKEKHSYKYFPSILHQHKDGYYDGYWQCHKYFDTYRDIILKTFQFIEFTDNRNIKLSRMISEDKNSVSIHIRRGDYLRHYLYNGLCGLDYYIAAIDKIKELKGPKLNFYIFSNDTLWCKENIIPCLESNRCIIVDWNQRENSFRDMQLMSLCQNNIIANSSFSWWAAYLNTKKDTVIIAPQKWINQPLEYSMQLPEWILL